MNNFSTLNHYESDLHQLERNNDNLTESLSLGVKTNKTEESPIFSNINFVEFEDTEISYFGV